VIHDLKIWPEFFEEVLADRKKAEIRKADRPFTVGDTLRLQEWIPEASVPTGREVMRTITYISAPFRKGDSRDFVVLSIAPVAVENTPSDAAYADQLMTYLHEVCEVVDPRMFDEPHASVDLVKWAKASLAEEREKATAALRELKAEAERLKADANGAHVKARREALRGFAQFVRPVVESEWMMAVRRCPFNAPWWAVCKDLIDARVEAHNLKEQP
jgi:hypothetical protein